MTVAKLIYTPKGDERQAFARTTHLAVAAHADDLEIMAMDGILKAQADDRVGFSGMILTHGGGAPRKGEFEAASDEELAQTRRLEQQAAAALGRYEAVVLMGYTSAEVRQKGQAKLVREIGELIEAFAPEVIYTHSLTDKHATHVAVCLRVIEALRLSGFMPIELIGCEVWRGLDWMPDEEKVLMDVSADVELQAALLRAHRSQTDGGKNYVEAVLGRRAANATFLDPYREEGAKGLWYGMDLMPFLANPSLNPKAYVRELIGRFQAEVIGTIEALE